MSQKTGWWQKVTGVFGAGGFGGGLLWGVDWQTSLAIGGITVVRAGYPGRAGLMFGLDKLALIAGAITGAVLAVLVAIPIAPITSASMMAASRPLWPPPSIRQST